MTVPHVLAQPAYRSFWMAGFEGADHINGLGQPLDMVAASGHDQHLEADYARLAALGIRTVRESLGWRLCEPNGRAGTPRFDFSRPIRFAEAARRHGLQILWSLMHYGTPDDVSLFDDSLGSRFAEFARAAVRALAPHADAAPVYTPVNEISFLAWAVADTDLLCRYAEGTLAKQRARAATPDLGFDVKCRLVEAAIAGMEAIRAEQPAARFLHVEPLIHIVPPHRAPERAAAAAEVSSWQWQAFDLLAGRAMPELGGQPQWLDHIGLNYYHDSQWELGGSKLDWHRRDPRRAPLAALLRRAAHRYGRPLLIAETSHVGSGRAEWLSDVAGEVERARRSGVDLRGVCLYPAVDRPDWSDAGHWHRSGLWDALLVDGRLERRLHFGYAKALRRWQRRVDHGPPRRPTPPDNSSPSTDALAMPHLLVFSHLRWNFVFQRPQHLLSRLGRDFPVVFIEEPVRSDGAAWLERLSPAPGVEVLRPHTPVEAPGFHDDQLSLLEPLIDEWLANEGVTDYAAWFYTPMALPLLGGLTPRAVIYDCMDELSAFKNAPRQMRQRETALIKRAQLILTGGPSLFEAKRSLHPNVMCLPSAVDAKHYAHANALADGTRMQRAAELQGRIAEPRLGFFGVIDERLDIGLVAALADAHPAWQIVMVGPVVKIDPAALPQRPNLHWLGQQSYELLPQLVAGWSVCLMPFAMNESTRFISPTKTLEYMAAGKPVVSTPVADVVAMFGDLVAIADDAPAFIAACGRAVEETAAARTEREAMMAERVGRYAWDATADEIRDAILRVLAEQPGPVAGSGEPADSEPASGGPAAGEAADVAVPKIAAVAGLR